MATEQIGGGVHSTPIRLIVKGPRSAVVEELSRREIGTMDEVEELRGFGFGVEDAGIEWFTTQVHGAYRGKVVSWFTDGPHSAPFPAGTLLSYQYVGMGELI